MSISRRSFMKMGTAAVAGATLMQVAASPAGIARAQDGARRLVADDPILHLLNRITWGTRPEELVHARAIGYNAYLEEQLNPYSIDDPAGDAALHRHAILTLSRNDMYRLTDREGRAYRAMVGGMIRRAVNSRRQLLERMVDFWTDHFNVSFGEEDGIVEMIVFQRDAIRQHALGNFRDMLFATAKTPAMLVYLDNFINSAVDPNENYARELMELHTIGVDGGYTEEDVVEVARAFTGWTTRGGRGDGFWFNRNDHDYNAKRVLGHDLPAGRGVEDGLHVLTILANHPSTAQFISRKLCVRFISDNPPQSIINSTAQVWMQTNGDIQSIMRHLLTSAEFRESVGQKFRRPLEFFIGALRATGTEFESDDAMAGATDRLGQRPFGWVPPNGYPDVAAPWLNTNGLMQRWNASMALTSEANAVGGVMVTNLVNRIGSPQTVGELVDAIATQVFGIPLAPDMAAPYVSYVTDNNGDANTPLTASMMAQKLGITYGLMLASPTFQWR